ncbi:hypothetical protein ACF0H5_010557 [Mactra antiquata]
MNYGRYHASLEGSPIQIKIRHKRKRNRKRIGLNLRNADYFPPEGHCCVKLKSIHCESTFLYFGGARRVQESGSKFGHDLFHITFEFDNDDAYISRIQRFDNIVGAQCPSLQSAGVWCDTRSVFVWGGLDTDTFETSNELIKLEFVRNKYHCTIFQPSGRGVLSKDVQKGHTPSGRTGRTVTLLSGHIVIMHDGVSLPNRHIPGISGSFVQVCENGSFNEFDSSTMGCTKIRNIPDVMPRAYHTANTVTFSGTKCIIIIGGMTFKGQSVPSERLPINELLFLKVHNREEHKYSLDKITAAISVDAFISYHSTVVLENNLYITGGLFSNRKGD